MPLCHKNPRAVRPLCAPRPFCSDPYSGRQLVEVRGGGRQPEAFYSYHDNSPPSTDESHRRHVYCERRQRSNLVGRGEDGVVGRRVGKKRRQRRAGVRSGAAGRRRASEPRYVGSRDCGTCVTCCAFPDHQATHFTASRSTSGRLKSVRSPDLEFGTHLPLCHKNPRAVRPLCAPRPFCSDPSSGRQLVEVRGGGRQPEAIPTIQQCSLACCDLDNMRWSAMVYAGPWRDLDTEG